MADDEPIWWKVLSDEDRQFLRRFLLASGSLKDLAAEYAISYPTVRLRLDRLIEKVRAAESVAPSDVFERAVRVMVADGSMTTSAAKQLLSAHRSALKKASEQ